MKLTPVLRSSSSCRLRFLRVALPLLPAVLCLAWLARAADANQATNEIIIPKSVFVSNDPRGKDPFFPNRPRMGLLPTAPTTNTVSTPGPNVGDLQLRGITGSPERRVALINTLPLEKGEEAEVRVSNGRLKIQVLEIREKSVLLRIDGQKEPKELLLPERLLQIAPE